jgi:hypothetical protein
MTEDQQRALITELLGIREGMATKADLLKLEEGLTVIIIKIAESITPAALPESPDPSRQDATNPHETPRRKEFNRLTERLDRLNNWYHAQQQDIERRFQAFQIQLTALEFPKVLADPEASKRDAAGERGQRLTERFDRLESWLLQGLAYRIEALERSMRIKDSFPTAYVAERADADLYAAAPDLLAAGKAKLADCDECKRLILLKDAALMPGEYCSDECLALAAAIAKAEGR